jgi:hypothetical protein
MVIGEGGRNGRPRRIAKRHINNTTVEDTRTTGAAIGNKMSAKVEAAPATTQTQLGQTLLSPKGMDGAIGIATNPVPKVAVSR